MKIPFTIEISEQTIEKVVRGIMDNYPEAGQGSTIQCVRWKYDEMEFTFEEYDDDKTKTHKLNKEKLLAAFPLMFSDKWPKGLAVPPASDDWDRWDDWLGQSDANDFDAFIQLACLGEVIYG